uniref:Transposase n=1 Tax=Burkholderia cepacia TaxID=292 RepID=J9RR40_BURCE|nr:transposase [Burkholderia cepacia]
MLFCGIDLHSNNSFLVISDENDKVLYSRRHPNNLEEIGAVLSPYKTHLFGVVVESTFNWYWLVDGLMDAGYTVHLANTTAIKQYDGLKHRGDESDARHLAHILRLLSGRNGEASTSNSSSLASRSRMPMLSGTTALCATIGWPITCSIASRTSRTTPPGGCGHIITSDPTWPSAALPQNRNWPWPHNLYSQVALKMGGLPFAQSLGKYSW